MGKRIALITSSFHPHLGGVEEHVRSTARELRARGHEVVVWTVDRGEHLGILEIDGFEVRYLPTPLPARALGPIARFALHAPLAWRAWTRAFKDFRPDVLHVQCFGPNGLYALALHRRYATPLVTSSHGETFMDDHGVFQSSALIRAAFARALRDSAAVTAVSSAVRDDVRSYGPAQISIVPNGVDLGLAPGGSTPHPQSPHRVVFSLGRLEHKKGFDLLLRAFAASGLAAEARVVIAGDGEQREALGELAHQLGLDDQVAFVGRLGPPEVASWMARSAVVVVPSRIEAFGIVALEAWRAGTPLVMTSHGGARDFVTDGVDGILVDPESLEDLAAAIRRVLDDPALAARLADAASRRVRDFTWARVAERYDALYAGALTRRRV